MNCLYVIDKTYMGDYILKQYETKDYLDDIMARFTYIYKKDTSELQYYLNGNKIGDPFKLDQVASKYNAETNQFVGLSYEDGVQFSLKNGITMYVQIAGMLQNSTAQGDFSGGLLKADVTYDGEGTFQLSNVGLESDLVSYESPSTTYIQKVAVNEAPEIDLNGDGKLEKVCYQLKEIHSGSYSYYEPVLTIGNKVYSNQDMVNMECYISDPSTEAMYLYDLNKSDSYVEIALFDYGPSDDPVTNFFRYDGKKLSYLGNVTDNPENTTLVVHGDGTITARKRLFILQTWWTNAVWKQDKNGKLIEQGQDVYDACIYGSGRWRTCYITDTVKLYQTANKNAKLVTFHAGEEIYYVATDEKNWVQIISKSGISGWFYVSDEGDVLSAKGETGFLSYLNMAD